MRFPHEYVAENAYITPQADDVLFIGRPNVADMVGIVRVQDLGVTSNGAGVPVGSIVIWFGTVPPPGWLLCDGSLFDAAEFPDLFSLLGANVLPDFTGMFPLGVSSSYPLGSSGGEESHALTVDELPSHNHEVQVRGGTGTQARAAAANSTTTTAVAGSRYTGGDFPHNNMPPYFAVNFIILGG